MTSSRSPSAVAFDCYGTLLRIADPRQPYLRLATLGGGRLEPSPMIAPLTLADVVGLNLLPIQISSSELRTLEVDLEAEVASIVPTEGAIGDSLANDYYGALAAGLGARHLAAGVILSALLEDLL